MPTTRISEGARQTLRDLADRTGRTQQELLEEAIERFRRERFLEELNEAFAALRRDEGAWDAELEERRAWDATLGDDLEADERGAPE